MNNVTQWVQARESLRQRKQQGLLPWTKDAILAKFRFTNVRRRDDRVSQWILQHVCTLPVPEGGMGLLHLGMFLALCRWVNWPPTIALLLKEGLWPHARPNWEHMGVAIDQRKASGEKTWTGAYMVRAERALDQHDFVAWGKGAYVSRIVVRREMTLAAQDLRVALRANTRQAVHAVLQRCYGWGSFMAGQVVDDWTWTPLLEKATDHFTWAPQGPGSVRGLNRLVGRPLTHRWGESEFLELLWQLRKDILRELGPAYEDLTLMDVQNCLCELDKYLRVKNGEGRPRSYYRPETAY